MQELIPNHLRLINQLWELEKKVQRLADGGSLMRPVERMKEALAELGYQIHNPQGENYDETRTDLEASIIGDKIKNLKVADVIKPIVYWKEGERNFLAQKGVVLVQA